MNINFRVLIYILDENDNSPIIDIYPDNIEINSNSIEIFLNESLLINSLLLSFSIIDRDSGDNGRVTWKMDRSNSLPFELIRLTENTGELRTKQILDRELISEYNLTIEAHDHGKPYSKSTYLIIHIIILDENDNIPKFSENNLIININEHVQFNNSYGYEIYHVHAEDFDEGLNGEIIYSFINNEYHFFNIDSNTGIIRAMKEFDKKEKDTYILQIQANDKGIPSLSSQQMITFKIINQNNYSPKCDIKNISWKIRENSGIGTIIGNISCWDDDNDELNGKISVESQWILEDKNSSIPFEIITKKNNISQSSISIILSVNGSIDREIISYYSLYLIISDHGNPHQSLNLSIDIEILDENDNCPQLHIDSSFIIINRDLTSNYFLLHLRASDNDKDLNGNITFQLSSSTSLSFINLYSNGTLLIQTNSNLIYDNSLIVLHIQISDHGQPTPCFIVEKLRLFIGTNKTDWLNVIKNNNYDDTSLRVDTEEFQQGKRMAHAYSHSSSSSSSISSISSRKQMFAVFVGTSILMFIVILTMILCFIDCIKKKVKHNSNISMIKTNGIKNHNSTIKQKNFYDDNSLTHHHYKSLKPIVVIASSNSHSSSSSIDSTTRANTAHNRAITNTYTYTALSTSDDLMPVDYDDNTNNIIDDNGIELMMTTV